MKREWPGLVFALVFPTFLAWFYFVLLAAGEGEKASTAQQLAYTLGKIVQFTFPVLFVWWIDRRFPRPGKPRFDGLRLGLIFGLIVAGVTLLVYYLWLRDSPAFSQAPKEIASKLTEFGLTTVPAYIALTAFVSLLHSLLEEYYWRWFVFGRLRNHLSFPVAAALSSLAFMAHHVIVVAAYLPGYFWTAVVPLSLCVAAGGFVWAWLFERTRTIYSSWLSHLIVDAAIYVIGYDLLRKTLFA